MKNKKMVPDIRFKGFSGNWEENILGNIGNFKNGMNMSQEDLGHGHSFVNLKNVFGKEVVDKNNLELVNSTSKQREEYSLKKGDILFIRSSVKFEGVGQTAIVDEDIADATYSGFIIRFRPEKNMDINYNRRLFYTKIIRKQILTLATSSANTNINQESLKTIKVKVPSIQEQENIGDFFTKIDNIIELCEEELENYKEYKKSMLQKMFPKKGEKIPEIRFAGYDDDWEEKKLGEISTVTGGGTPSTTNDDYWNGDIDWYSPTEIGDKIYADGSIKKITELGFQKSSAKRLPANKTILFTSRAGIGDMAILSKEGTTNQGFQSIVLNDNYDVYFIFSMGFMIKDYALKHASGSTFLEISGKELGKMKLKLPSLPEQEKIGSFFKNLDSIIEKQEEQLENYKDFKKSMLQKMFV